MWALTADLFSAFPNVVAVILKTVVCNGKHERLWKGSMHCNVMSKDMRLHSHIRFSIVKWGF